MTQACACLYADELVQTALAAAIMASLFTQSIVCIISHNRTMLRCSSAAAKNKFFAGIQQPFALCRRNSLCRRILRRKKYPKRDLALATNDTRERHCYS